MTKHSSIVGGSTAGRLVNCPASHATILALPPAPFITSEYAEEGTAIHEVMAALMRAREQGLHPSELYGAARSWVAREFHDRELSYGHINTMIDPALDALAELEKIYGGGFRVVCTERRVQFPGVPGAFGTIDLILQSDTHVLHVDWKFGAGVGVQAVYSDDNGDVVNAQLMYYLAAARNTLSRQFYGKRKLVIAIIQPRGTEPLTHTVVTAKEVKMFVEDVVEAVIAATDRDPPRVRGEWCRFAPCKVICPLWTGPLLDLSALGDPPQRTTSLTGQVTAYGNYLAVAKALVDNLTMIKGDIDKQMHAFLEDGGVIPGWRLKAKAKLRQWVDTAVVVKALTSLGFQRDQIVTEKLVTFAAADVTAKRLGVTIPDDLRVAPPTSETTIARTSDPAPVVEPKLAVDQFRAALVQLTNGDAPGR